QDVRPRPRWLAESTAHRTRGICDLSCASELSASSLHRSRQKFAGGAVNIGDAIHKTVIGATKKWADIEKKKIRDEHRGVRALERYYRGVSREPSIKEAAFAVMSEAYGKASGGGRYPATARQVMYAARPLILAYTDKPLGKDFDSYFTQGLLPEYM